MYQGILLLQANGVSLVLELGCHDVLHVVAVCKGGQATMPLTFFPSLSRNVPARKLSRIITTLRNAFSMLVGQW